MFLFFLLLFFLLCARVGWDVLLFGTLSAALLFGLCTRVLDYSLKKELRFWRLLPAVLSYLFFLLREMVAACLKVMGLILSSKYRTEPCLVTFETRLTSPVLRAALANSITLTPGTITVSLTGATLTVHCLDSSFASGLKEGAFEARLMRMERLEAEREETL